MNNQPIKFYLVGDPRNFVEVDNALDIEIAKGKFLSDGETPRVFVDLEDFVRMKAALVVKLKQQSMTMAAIFVIGNLDLEHVIGLAPDAINYDHAATAIEDIATEDAKVEHTTKIGLYAEKKDGTPVFGKPETGRKPKAKKAKAK